MVKTQGCTCLPTRLELQQRKVPNSASVVGVYQNLEMSPWDKDSSLPMGTTSDPDSETPWNSHSNLNAGGEESTAQFNPTDSPFTAPTVTPISDRQTGASKNIYNNRIYCEDFYGCGWFVVSPDEMICIKCITWIKGISPAEQKLRRLNFLCSFPFLGCWLSLRFTRSNDKGGFGQPIINRIITLHAKIGES